MADYTSASTYPGIEATPLARHGYSDVILSKIYEKDWLPRITSSELLEPVTKCLQSIQIMRAPEVGPMRPYMKNQELVPSTVTTDAVCLSINNIGYQDIKFDSLDIQMACERWGRFEEKLQDSLFQRWVESQRSYVLGRMLGQVSPKTSLNTAGRNHDINLGSPGNPRHINPQNLVVALGDMQRALLETLRWVPNEMFLIVPPLLRTYLAMSNYSNSLWSCKCGGIIDGMWDHELFGFQPIESVHVPVRIDESGALSFYILGGHKEATAYAANIIDARLIDKDPNHFGVRYQFLAAWGAEVIYPDALVLGYWTFDPITV